MCQPRSDHPRSGKVDVFLQFSDYSVIVTEPAEFRCFGVEIVFEILFDEPCDAEQPPKFGTTGVMRGHRMGQELNCRREVFAAVGFGEPGYVRESWPKFVHRRYKKSAEVHGETMGTV